MNARTAVAALGLAVAAALAMLWLGGAPPEPESGPGASAPEEPAPAEPGPSAAAARPAPAEPASAAPAPSPPADEERSPDHGEHADHGVSDEATADLELYAGFPMSAVPHQVVKGWGARGSGRIPGVVGAYVVVEPGIDDEELAQLARDIRAYHADAEALSVRILDSEQAATYDRHSDGGELVAAHLVGLVNRNTRLGMDRIEIRGRTLDPSDAPSP